MNGAVLVEVVYSCTRPATRPNWLHQPHLYTLVDGPERLMQSATSRKTPRNHELPTAVSDNLETAQWGLCFYPTTWLCECIVMMRILMLMVMIVVMVVVMMMMVMTKTTITKAKTRGRCRLATNWPSDNDRMPLLLVILESQRLIVGNKIWSRVWSCTPCVVCNRYILRSIDRGLFNITSALHNVELGIPIRSVAYFDYWQLVDSVKSQHD